MEVVNDAVDPTFRFMSVDWDGKIRMDCSSPYAMATLIGLKDRFDIAFGNDADSDRHGIVTRGAGLMNPNHFLAAAISYLFTHRPGWPPNAAVGKTAVSSSVIDRVAAKAHRSLVEVPVGFKWFVSGLLDASLGFGGEESAGASFLRRDGTVWVTEKDGIIMDLLAVELMARTGRDPSELYRDLTSELGESVYERIDAPATAEQKAVLLSLSPKDFKASELAGDPIEAILTAAPGNGEPLGGLKVVTAQGWLPRAPPALRKSTSCTRRAFAVENTFSVFKRKRERYCLGRWSQLRDETRLGNVCLTESGTMAEYVRLPASSRHIAMPANEREPLDHPERRCRPRPARTSRRPPPVAGLSRARGRLARLRHEAGLEAGSADYTGQARHRGRCRAKDRAAASSSLHVRTLEGTREHRLLAGTRGRAAVAARVVARAGAADAVVDGTPHSENAGGAGPRPRSCGLV